VGAFGIGAGKNDSLDNAISTFLKTRNSSDDVQNSGRRGHPFKSTSLSRIHTTPPAKRVFLRFLNIGRRFFVTYDVLHRGPLWMDILFLFFAPLPPKINLWKSATSAVE